MLRQSSVEQILDLPKIVVSILLEAEGVVRAGQGGIEAGQSCVDCQKRRMLGAGGTAAGDVLLPQDAHTHRERLGIPRHLRGAG